MKREEGHYTIKRVKTLPKRGNANLLYHIKKKDSPDRIEKFYRWTSQAFYEEILLGGNSGILPEYTLSNISSSNVVGLLRDGVQVSQIDLSSYLDNTNLPRVVSGIVDSTGIATFVRDDSSSFTIDFSGIIAVDLVTIPQYDNINQATTAIGENQYFRWSENNVDGVPSPRASQLGITKN